MKPILLDNGKTPDEPYNASLGFWLPPDSPYGNFSLKLMKVCQRVDEANRRVIDSFNFWTRANTKGILPINAHERHFYANEQFIYLIRRTADELIALMWCLSHWEVKGAYPSRILVDSIGAAIQEEYNPKLIVVVNHQKNLMTLNEISNALKHSFIQTDINMIGSEEPCIFILSFSRNRISKPQFFGVPLKKIVSDFNIFYQDSLNWLKGFSDRHRM